MKRALYGFLLLALTAVGCRKAGPGVAELQEKQEEVSRRTDDLAREVRLLRSEYKKALDAKEADFNEFALGVRRLNETADAIRDSMEKFAAYKRDYRKRVRAKAPGMELGEVVAGTRTYQDARVKEVTDTHIALMHQSGTTRIPLSQAPLELQDLFAHDPVLDTVVAEATGTGTDWLLSALDSAQKLASSAPAPRATFAANPSETSRAPASSVPALGYDASCYYSDRPAWRRFSSFTGSFWAPLQNRRRATGSVNYYPSGYFNEP